MPTVTPRAAAAALTTEITPSLQGLGPPASRADNVDTEAAGTPRSPRIITPSTAELFLAMPASLAIAPLAAIRITPSDMTRLELAPLQITSPGIFSLMAVVPGVAQIRPCGVASTTTGASSAPSGVGIGLPAGGRG